MPTNADTKEPWQIFHILQIHYLKIFPPCDIQEPFYLGILLFIQTPDGNYSVWGVWDTLANWQRSDSFKEKHTFGRNKWIYAQLNVLLWDFLTCLCSGEAQPARWSLTWLCSLSRAHACVQARRPARTHTFPVLSGRSSGRHSHERVVPSLSVFGLAPPITLQLRPIYRVWWSSSLHELMPFSWSKHRPAGSHVSGSWGRLRRMTECSRAWGQPAPLKPSAPANRQQQDGRTLNPVTSSGLRASPTPPHYKERVAASHVNLCNSGDCLFSVRVTCKPGFTRAGAGVRWRQVSSTPQQQGSKDHFSSHYSCCRCKTEDTHRLFLLEHFGKMSREHTYPFDL